MPFKPGHQRYGGRKLGSKNKATLAREQLVAHALKSVELTAEEVEAVTPLEAMRLVMIASLTAGGLGHRAIHAPKLASADMRVTSPYEKPKR
jgi:hypothetical protein